MYGTAACVNLAMKHVMQGPKFWEENIVPTGILKQIKELSVCEQTLPYTEKEKLELKFADINLKTKIFPVLIRKLTFYGHLLPSSKVKKTPKAMIYKYMTPNKKRVYMHDQITVLDELQRKKVVLKRDPVHYFRNLAEFSLLSLKMFCLFGMLRKAYAKGSQKQRTRDFWKSKFCD